MLDAKGAVWPQIATEESLRHERWHRKIAPAILACLDAPRSRRSTPQGYIDAVTGIGYCNA
jgi:hypothetical protein